MTKHFCDRCEREFRAPQATAVFVVDDWAFTAPDYDIGSDENRRLMKAGPRLLCPACSERLMMWLTADRAVSASP